MLPSGEQEIQDKREHRGKTKHSQANQAGAQYPAESMGQDDKCGIERKKLRQCVRETMNADLIQEERKKEQSPSTRRDEPAESRGCSNRLLCPWGLSARQWGDVQ